MSDKSERTYTVTDLYEAATYAVYGKGHEASKQEVAQALAERLGLTLRPGDYKRLSFQEGRIVDASTGEVAPESTLLEAVKCYNAVRKAQEFAKSQEGREEKGSYGYKSLYRVLLAILGTSSR